MSKVAICGAGGFIGGHLTKRLLDEGFEVQAVDVKPLKEWYQRFDDARNLRLDLQLRGAAWEAVRDCEQVYNLAADMGGMGFIETHKADCMLSELIDMHLLLAAREQEVERFFYASSACIYPGYLQNNHKVQALKEEDAYPADPEDGYGWQKLFTERLCRHFRDDYGLATRIGRFHNSYGPMGTYEGGREKAPAAICRKVAEAVVHGHRSIEIWGDGNQTRSFMFVDDNIEGIRRLMDSDFAEPLNIGSSESVTINQLVGIVEEIAGVELERTYKLDAPQGVRGRNSDNTLIQEVLGWEPSTSLRDGLEVTYRWVLSQVQSRSR